MKNKKLTYLLLFLVVSLWGYLIYKVFGAVSGNHEPALVSSSAPSVVENLDYYKFKNEDSLLLDYRDPLYTTASGNKAITVENTAPEVAAAPIVSSPPPVIVRETVINYTGFIENENSKKRVAIVNIDNKQHMICAGEAQSGVHILEIQNDHIRIKHKGSIKTINK